MGTRDQAASTAVPVGSGPSGRRSGRDLLAHGIALAVGLATVVTFLPVLDNRFVNQWDDQSNFLGNDAFRGLGGSQIHWAWTTLFHGAYQPLAWMLLEAEYGIVGLEPAGYHFVSLVLHAVVAILFYALTRALVSRALPPIDPGRQWAIPVMSGLAALWFALHPLRVEVVAWASCQPYLPCAGFALLSVLAYLRGCGSGRCQRGWLLASVCLFAAALGCKAVAVGLPLVLLILDVAVLHRLGTGRLPWGVWVEKIPYLVLATAAAVLAIQAKMGPYRLLDPHPAGAGRIVERIAVAGYGLGYYLRKTIWPLGLSAYHYRPDPVYLAEPRFLGSLAAVAALAIVAYQLRRRRPALLAALLAYVILLAPNLGLVSYDLMLVADRYAYLATMPLFVVAAGALVRCVAVSRQPRAVAFTMVGTGLGLAGTLAALSWAQCRTWRDSNTLVSQALRVGSGRDALLESNFGFDLFTTGHVEEAMAHLLHGILLDPVDADVQENLGVVLVERRDITRAIPFLAEAVRLAPSRFDFRHHLGLALAWKGRLDEAVDQLNAALRLRPDRAQLHVSLGDVLAAQQRRDEAAAEFAEALRLDPHHPGARQGIAKLQRRRGSSP
jgi:tetratricopeptide (TPR) repeat protein